MGYESTSLWRSSLGQLADDPYDDARARLRAAYQRFRERAAYLAAEIPQDLKDFTVHDVSHADALWGFAGIIAGPQCSLTPTEGFVLGGAFLIHDLGMGLAAWTGGMAELMSQPGWIDILRSCIRDELGRLPTADEISNPPDLIVERAKNIALRENHAKHAANLACESWTLNESSSRYYLIPDDDLRETYGNLIGLLAASHGWTIDQVATEFTVTAIGAPIGCPEEWTLDPLKLACLLRLADAAHIDAGRAPSFLRAIRHPSRSSDDHWQFQSHIQQPRSDKDRLIYTAARPFPVVEASSWWLCFETLQMIDKELQQVDSLLFDSNRQRMKVRSVQGADSPLRLRELIPTDQWTPVDARVVISDVPALVRKLGGQSLYGRESYGAALRELIQNASDATLARRTITNVPPSPIEVRLRNHEGNWILEVVDSGVGMSQQVITGPLLDFGNSYWGSQLMRTEMPSLTSSSFRATGQYGIGFYSVFMLGDFVKVVSCRFDAAITDGRALEFASGLDDRPILRKATVSEMRYTGGTVVAVQLNQDPYGPDGLLDTEEGTQSLGALCAAIAPGLPCDLSTSENGEPPTLCVEADDWKTMPPEDLLQRLGSMVDKRYYADTSLEFVAERIRSIEREGQVIARASLAPSLELASMQDGSSLITSSALVSNGLYITKLQEIAGIFNGIPVKADRSRGVVIATPDEVKAWASEQARLWVDDLNKDHKDFSPRVAGKHGSRLDWN